MPSSAAAVEKFFQLSLLGLVASGFLAVAGSGYLDAPTTFLMAAGLVLRGAMAAGLIQLDISEACGVLVLTSGLFFLLPRTANAALRHLASKGYYLPGFSNQVTLGQIGEMKTRSSPAMHVRVYNNGGQLDAKWRGPR